jgi:hypothetical protein
MATVATADRIGRGADARRRTKLTPAAARRIFRAFFRLTG